MRFHTRKWVKPEDLNPNGTLFGGRLLEWIDEEALMDAVTALSGSGPAYFFRIMEAMVKAAQELGLI